MKPLKKFLKEIADLAAQGKLNAARDKATDALCIYPDNPKLQEALNSLHAAIAAADAADFAARREAAANAAEHAE